MQYHEEEKDLFKVDKTYYLAHCISADFGMGAGIAVLFNRRFDMKQRLRLKYPNYMDYWNERGLKGDCIVLDRVFNLVTKKKVYEKPTYDSLHAALLKCKKYAIENDIEKIAMPLIGCGLDQLKWENVSEIIKEIFKNTDIEILICIWE